MNVKDFIHKCVYEGGNLFSGLEYGLRSSDLNDDDPKFKEMVKNAEDLYLKFEIEANKIYEIYGCFEDSVEDDNF